MLIDTFHAAFEHAVEAFDRVRVDQTPAPFIRAVTNKIVGKLPAKVGILTGLIRHDVSAGRNMRFDDRQQVGSGRAFNVEGTRASAIRTALDQCQHNVLVRIAPRLRSLLVLSADEGLVNLHNFALAAHRRNR